MLHNKKDGQAAIEFMVTYGWAIMAALLVIGALTYFGVTNPAASLPDKCIFSNNLECKDYLLTTTEVKVEIANGIGQTIYSITAVPTDGVGGCTTTGSTFELLPEDSVMINCTGLTDMPFNAREKGKVKLTVNYAKISGGFNQVSLGELYATVQ